jgi:lipopolysaccharide transport system ATP-binding protein
MQVVPKFEPFIGGAPGVYHVELGIELPPLVPDLYTLDFWIGLHNAETFDLILQALTIEIVDSPDPTRSFPYVHAHGAIVPMSTVKIRAS